VVRLLRECLTTGSPGRTGIPAARIARREAYQLLDLLFFAGMAGRLKVELLVELLVACPDEQTVLLLTNALLCYPDEAFERLMAKFWETESPEALHRPPDPLYALCRMGSRFAAALLEPLRDGDARRQLLALDGAEALARSLTGSGLDLDNTPDDRVALEARFRRKWAPPLARDRDPAVLQALADRVAAFLADERALVREKALRTLGALRASAHHVPIAECARHPLPSTRLAALRALGEIGDPAAAPLLMEAARSGKAPERAAAAWALGRLRAEAAAPLLLELAGDRDREVRGAAVSALGALGGDAARARLEVLARACEQYAGRSMRRMTPREKGEAPSLPPIQRMEDRVREGAEPPFTIALDAAMRALPALQPHDERELSRLIGQLCRDFASTRRYLVDEGLMSRETSVYRFTPLGEAVWRVERFIRDRYVGG
jgi:HEAT repeat protein